MIEFVLNETNFNKGVNYKDNYDTALYWAARKGHLECFKFLYSKGADVNVVDSVSFFLFFFYEFHKESENSNYFLINFYSIIGQYFILQHTMDI